ncbi:phosphotransferase [Gloeobacter morelensis]|uniref:phosphotransferase n=1 Tax=Gloeobacter morelensis TaxID=2907343 RepID=UPI00211B33F5|nr:phosphotransferase [Gloeobacter morelensis]
MVRVETDARRYALRVCEPQVSAAQLQTELDWLQALKRDTDLCVPTPVTSVQGNLVTASIDESAVQWWCVLFDWIDGEPVSRQMSEQAAARVGELAAELHLHARRWTPNVPSHIGLRQFDPTWLAGPASWWASGRALAALGRPTWQALDRAVQLAVEAMQDLGESSEVFGLIHSDLHFGNILVTEGGYAVIDFDGCALGHYLFDLAVIEAEFLDYPMAEAYIAAFRNSYSCASKSSTLSPQLLQRFSVPAAVVFLEWVYTSPNPAVREDKLSWVPVVVEQILSTL